MTNFVKIVECPRDAWQGLPGTIPSEVKADYLRRLIAAGFRHLDAVSFVSASAVPQMADAEKVLSLLQPQKDVEVIGIVVNTKGAERAIATGFVRTLGFPYSVSPEFLKRNQKQTTREALETLSAIGKLATKAGLELVVYISMAFGNPYGDAWSIGEIKSTCDLLIGLGVHQVSLADTVGVASPEKIFEVYSAVLKAHNTLEFGVHLHARNGEAPARIEAAYAAGCRRFDAAIGGLGGCPFAQDSLVGNIATEQLMETLEKCGAHLPEFHVLPTVIQTSARIAQKYTVPCVSDKS